MAERRWPSGRVALGLAIVIVGLVEVQNLVQTVRSHARLRDRVVRGIRESVIGARPRLVFALRSGGADSWKDAAHEALRSSLATEVETFEPTGQRLVAYPAVAPVQHWPGETDLASVRAGNVLTVGPVAGDSWRVLTYFGFDPGNHPLILRLSVPVPELMEDVKERRALLLSHSLALLVLAFAGAVVFLHREERPEAPSGALQAYEAAMERLRDQGLQVSLQHQAERRQMEEHIQDREALARAGELTAGIVHEVRNGLGTILGYARLMERSSSPVGVPETARHIREECETLEGVVRRFMDFVRRESLDPAPFDLVRMLTRLVARESQGRDGIQVELDLPEAENFVGDEALLERAFENLVRNACDAAGPGGRVKVRLTSESGRRVVTIADNGPGLPAQTLEKLRPFFSTKAGGLGLGLPIALKIVRLHEGRLEFGEASPQGLLVRVWLPSGSTVGAQRASAPDLTMGVTSGASERRGR